MIIDHLGFFFFPDQVWMRILGRGAAPIFFFVSGRDTKGAIFPILACGLILSFCQFASFGNPSFLPFDTLIGIWLGKICNRILRPERWKSVCIAAFLLYIPLAIFLDYGSAFLFVPLFYRACMNATPRIEKVLYAHTTIFLLSAPQIVNRDYSNTDRICVVLVISIVILFSMDALNLLSKSTYYLKNMRVLRFLSRHSLFAYFIHITLFSLVSQMIKMGNL